LSAGTEAFNCFSVSVACDHLDFAREGQEFPGCLPHGSGDR
jgi:hypothetical protein